MESGFVDYKICDRDFDCENCPFDKAIHAQCDTSNIVKHDEIDEIKNLNPKFGKNREIPADLFISKNHVWIKKISRECFYLGVDHLLQSVIKRISNFQFPFIGSEVTKGKPIFWIIGKWGVVSIPSPINCVITEVNSEVLLNLNKFFFEDIYKVWLLKVKSSDLINSIKFTRGEKSKNLLDKDLAVIKNFTEEMVESPMLGSTMYDGGELLTNLHQHLSNRKYVQLLNLILNK